MDDLTKIYWGWQNAGSFAPDVDPTREMIENNIRDFDATDDKNPLDGLRRIWIQWTVAKSKTHQISDPSLDRE